MRTFILFMLLVTASMTLSAQNKPAYKLYNAKGAKVTFKKMFKKMKKADIILFGEHHNNPIIHWLQLETTKALYNTTQLTLGAEMIEADNQEVLNNYLSGKITHRGLDSTARLWKNFKTDYKPLVDFAKSHDLKFIGTNIPRIFASKVYRGGFEALDALSVKEKLWVAPLPIEYDPNLPGYVKMKEMMGAHGSDNLPKAQAIKDATMAYFIIKNKEKDKLFVHYNGSYHSDNYEGIYWYLKQTSPDMNIITVSSVEQDNIKKFKKENKHKADFIIAVPKSMTKTF